MQPQAVEALSGITDYHPPTPMQGSVEDRIKAIAAALASDDEPIAQFNFQDRSLEIALHFLANRARVDLRIDWAGLERAGISRDHATSTINLFNGTLREAFLALLWQQRTNSGGIRFWIEGGRINIAPSVVSIDLVDTDATRALNARIKSKLAEPLDLGERRGTTDALENAIYIPSFSKKKLASSSTGPNWNEPAFRARPPLASPHKRCRPGQRLRTSWHR